MKFLDPLIRKRMRSTCVPGQMGDRLQPLYDWQERHHYEQVQLGWITLFPLRLFGGVLACLTTATR